MMSEKTEGMEEMEEPLKLFMSSASAFARFEFGKEVASIFRLRDSMAANTDEGW